MIKSLQPDLKQDEIIKNIIDLHNEGKPIELDLTYSKGVFYKSGLVEEPKFKIDLNYIGENIINCDFTNTPFEDETVESIMFDPPFLITGKTYKENKEGSSIIAKRFTCYYNWEELKQSYIGALKESFRLLKKDGILIVKCQNTVSSGKQHFSHFLVLKTAIELGLYPIDEFVLQAKSKITSFGGRWKTQKHAMKMHSYVLVFKKTKNKVNYETT